MSAFSEQYKSYQDVFEKKNADILPQHRPYDCAIDIKDGAQVPFGPITPYSLNWEFVNSQNKVSDVFNLNMSRICCRVESGSSKKLKNQNPLK